MNVSSSVFGRTQSSGTPVTGGVLRAKSDRALLWKVRAAYEGKSRGSESRFELALLDPSLPPDILYAFFAGEDEGKCAGLDDEPADIRVGQYNRPTKSQPRCIILTRKQRPPAPSRGAMHPNCTACDRAA